MIIGLTGGSGCGKSTALRAARACGARTLDCDTIYHTLLDTDAALQSAISARFPGVFSCGVLDRRALGEIVFRDPAALCDLNAITHHFVCDAVRERLKTAPALTVIEAIALFESGLSDLCDRTVAVTAPEEARIRRLMARDGISREYAKARIAAQLPQQAYVRMCDETLENTADADTFYAQCLAFFQNQAIIGKDKTERRSTL